MKLFNSDDWVVALSLLLVMLNVFTSMTNLAGDVAVTP